MMRDARISLVTLGVDDLGRAAAFYEALGWTRTAAGNESVIFLQGEGMVLSLFGRQDLAADVGRPAADSAPPPCITLAVNVSSAAEVDRLYDTALSAGAFAVKPPAAVFWGGYSGYVADPDGHLWELAHNPFFAMTATGQLDLISAPEGSSPNEGPA